MIYYIDKLIAWLTRWRNRLEKATIEFELGAARSPGWPKARRKHLREYPRCAVCGRADDLDVHHVVPFHSNPSLELDPANLITLCTPHHLLVGHLMSWKSWNETVRGDAMYFLTKIAKRP